MRREGAEQQLECIEMLVQEGEGVRVSCAKRACVFQAGRVRTAAPLSAHEQLPSRLRACVRVRARLCACASVLARTCASVVALARAFAQAARATGSGRRA
eukprot:6052503-Pleurochrysis_carterae.AAC.1